MMVLMDGMNPKTTWVGVYEWFLYRLKCCVSTLKWWWKHAEQESEFCGYGWGAGNLSFGFLARF